MNAGSSLVIDALLARPVPRTPVWIMRQAGRYLPEYRELRARSRGFMNMIHTPEIACEVTLQPLRRYPLDAAILFSDILCIPDAMGFGLSFVEGVGPRFERRLEQTSDIDRLGVPDPESDLAHISAAARLVRAELEADKPLIGFAGSPWTLACYLFEGGTSPDFARARALLKQDPASMHKLLALLARAVAASLRAQIDAGVQAVMLFDSWGGLLSAEEYPEFSLAYCARIAEELPAENAGAKIPRILFAKGAAPWLSDAGLWSGYDAFSVDWLTDLGAVRRATSDRVALQGNLDPHTLFAGPEKIRAGVEQVLASYGHGHGHVFNLGHGIGRDTPTEAVQTMLEAVRELSPQWKGAARPDDSASHAAP